MASSKQSAASCGESTQEIELHLDNENGPLIGTLPLSYTGGRWKMQTTAVSGALGVHDLFLTIKGDPTGKLFKTDYWKFEKKTVPAQLVALSTTAERYKIDSTPGSAHKIPLTISAIYSDGTTRDVTTQAKIKVQIPGIASVKKGVITGLKPGETLLNVNFKGKSDAFPIIVEDLGTGLILGN